MKVTKSFINALVTVLEYRNTAFGLEVENQSVTEWNVTFENGNSIKTEIYFSAETEICTIGAIDVNGKYHWFSNYRLEKMSRDVFFFTLAETLRTIDDEMCKVNDAIWESKNVG